MPTLLTTSFARRLTACLQGVPLEAYIWAAGLAALAWTDPTAPGLLELCLAKAVGLPGCPGCGLGHAIAHLLDGDWAASWSAHVFGAPALGILGARIFRLARPAFTRTFASPTSVPDV